MGKNLLVLSVWVSVLMLASCVGRKKETVTYTPEEIADAGQVMKYYDTSLALLKNMVKERDVNAVLGYMEQKTEVPMFSYIMSPVISKKDSAEVMLPGECFGADVRQNLIQNYAELFQSRNQFYANFNKYLSLLKEKKTKGMVDLLNDNYEYIRYIEPDCFKCPADSSGRKSSERADHCNEKHEYDYAEHHQFVCP